MSTTMDTIEHLGHPAGSPSSTRATGPLLPFALPAFVVGVAATGAAIVSVADVAGPSEVRWAATGVAAVWGLAGVLIGLRRRSEPLGFLVALVAACMAAVLAGSAGADTSSGRVRDLAATLLAAVLFHLALGLPEGRLGVRWRRVLVGLGYVAAIVVGATARAADREIGGATVALGLTLAVVALGAYASRCRRAGAVERARLQWAGWGVVVASLVVLVTEIVHLLLEWPPSPGAVAVAATALVPVSLALSAWDGIAVRIDRLLVHTIVVAGLVTIVAVVYLLVVLGLGNAPDDADRDLLGLSMVAAVLAAVVALPARRSLDELARRRVYGDRRSPDEAIQTFGSRMSRAVPMDELLLQLAESLKLSMQLVAAEVWTGSDGVLERVVSVPDRGPARIVLSEEELPVVARARVSGNAWLQVWLPSLVEGRGECVVRVAPVVHSGILLGLLVAERASDAIPFTDESERVLTELARQVGLALHNVRLDSALQASLETLQERNEELQASRLRIVTASDESRRRIERNLHDGAQQHLVALAVKVGLARQLMDADPETVKTMLEELRGDVQTTLGELRELAHGIYPPLLRDRGLAEALRTAANRAVLPTEVISEGIERYPSETEAAVYFCCLEAMQNAGKHAGEGATMTVTITGDDQHLDFCVADTGAGFDTELSAQGHGFVNMRDRLGAVGGTLIVESAPDSGTRIGGHIPLVDAS
ncbi:MAG TPA: histidine kinase [Acidimicrobiia bacterium]|jgi:signal transduction histidine kinase